MDAEYINSLKISEASIIEIYNTVPRTLSQSAIVVSVNQDSSFKQETSGNFWIIKIDISTGWLFPKRRQVFDKYQYSSLQNLFRCSGYEQYNNKEFVIQKPAQVSFNTDKKQWHLANQGILKFGDNSPATRLRKALEERERLLSNSQQDKLEIEKLHNDFQASQNIATQRKAEIDELKVNHTKLLDLFTELQQDKKRQEKLNDNLESFLKKERRKSEQQQEEINNLRKRFAAIPNKLKSLNDKYQQQFQNDLSDAQEELDNLRNRISYLNNQQSQHSQDVIFELTKLTEESSVQNISYQLSSNYTILNDLDKLVINYNNNARSLVRNTSDTNS